MSTDTTKQANASHEISSQNLRSINIQELWSQDQRYVGNNSSRGSAYCSSLLEPGRGSSGKSTSIEDCTEGTNEVDVVIEGTIQSVTGVQRAGDFGDNSFLAVYRGLGWNDSLAMLNWRLQEAYAEEDESSTITTGTAISSSVRSSTFHSDVSEAIVDEIIAQELLVPDATFEETILGELVENEAMSPLEPELCYSIFSSDSSNDIDRDSEGINSQQTNVSAPTLERLASESTSAAPPPENIYHGLSWTDSLKMLNQNLQEAYEKNDTGNLKISPINTTRPQINFCAEDPPIHPLSCPPGLPLFTPNAPLSPNFTTQQRFLGHQQQVYPTDEPNWGPYPDFSQQKAQIPPHLFCPSAAHAISCGGIFVDPRAVAAIDHIVHNSAMLMFENFRRQFLAMEGKPNVGWWPVHGSGLDSRGATHTPTWAVNDPGVTGNSGRGGVSNGINKEPHGEIDEEASEETEDGIEVGIWPATKVQDTASFVIDTQPITPRLSVHDSSTQADAEPVQNQSSVTKTLSSSSQTDIIEIPSTRDFGSQTNVPEVTTTNKNISSSAQTISTKTCSIGTSTIAESPPEQIHSAPETQPQPSATKKYRYKRKNKAKTDTSGAAPRPPSPPPLPDSSTAACESLSTPEQTTTSITMNKIKETSPEPFIRLTPVLMATEQDSEPMTKPFKLTTQETTTQPIWLRAVLLCSILFLVLDFAFGPEGDI